jgi:hypothetical protein
MTGQGNAAVPVHAAYQQSRHCGHLPEFYGFVRMGAAFDLESEKCSGGGMRRRDLASPGLKRGCRKATRLRRAAWALPELLLKSAPQLICARTLVQRTKAIMCLTKAAFDLTE